MIRVTVGSASYGALNGLQTNASRLAALQAQLSSGKQITKPSDDPSGTIQALQLRGEVARNAQYATNASDAIGFMSTADSTYQQMVALTQQARTLVVQGLNTGANTGTSASAIADQIDAIRSSLISLANTTYNGQPVFGGNTAGAIAYSADGQYQGTGQYDAATGVVQPGTNAGVSRTVGPSTTVQINQIGPEIFGNYDTDPTDTVSNNTDPAQSPNLFQLLSGISNTLRTNSNPAADLGNDLTALDSAIGRISTAQAAEGATYNQVQTAQTVQASTKLSLDTALSDIQDIDLADMAVKVSTAQTTYQASLQTTASIQQMSLLNFLH